MKTDIKLKKIDINFKRDIWDNCPPTITTLSNKSKIYQFFDSVFDVIIKNRSIRDINFLREQVFLDSANGEWLDIKGKLYGLKRLSGEDDSDFRERIKRIKVIKLLSQDSPGLNRRAFKEFLNFYTDLNDIKIYDENSLNIKIENRDANTKDLISNFITKPQNTWHRAYVRFFNMPNTNIKHIKNTIDSIIEPYHLVNLLPYTGERAVKKILDYYNIDYELEYPRYGDSSFVHSKQSISKAYISIKLKSNPLLPVEKLKATLEERVKTYKYYIYFSNWEILLSNYLNGTYEDITNEMLNKDYNWAKDLRFLYIKINGNIRVNVAKLTQLIEDGFSLDKVVIEDNIYREVKKILPSCEIVYPFEMGFIRPATSYHYESRVAKKLYQRIRYSNMVTSTSDSKIYIFHSQDVTKDIESQLDELEKQLEEQFVLAKIT